MLALYARLMLFFMQYARNMLEIYQEICVEYTNLLSSCCFVCSIHGRSTSTSILGGVFLFFLWSKILEMVENDAICSNMLEKWCNMLDLCSGCFFFHAICSENMPACSMRGRYIPYSCNNQLIKSSHFGYEKIVRSLISHGADVNITSGSGNTALMKAAEAIETSKA